VLLTHDRSSTEEYVGTLRMQPLILIVTARSKHIPAIKMEDRLLTTHGDARSPKNHARPTIMPLLDRLPA
jgi:hypothetical protein